MLHGLNLLWTEEEVLSNAQGDGELVILQVQKMNAI